MRRNQITAAKRIMGLFLDMLEENSRTADVFRRGVKAFVVACISVMDKVLKAHLDDNRETIERLFEEREAVASRQPKAEER